MASGSHPSDGHGGFRRVLTCVCILLNCLSAGSSYCFPLFGPVLTKRMGLSSTQTNAIFLGGLIGLYSAALVMGAVADRSTRVACLMAALFFQGYALMARALAQPAAPSLISFVIFFLLAGIGTVSSYFAAMTSATRSFPSHPGLCIGVVSACFGLSPLLLSTVAGALFTKNEGSDSGDIDAVRLFSFLAILLGAVNLFSAFGMRPPIPTPEEAKGTEAGGSSLLPEVQQPASDEATPLLASQSHTARIPHVRLVRFMRKSSVWMFLFVILFVNGPSEVISQNLGAVCEAFIPIRQQTWPEHAALQSRKRQIQIFSLLNTVSRLAFGALSDFTCPSNSSASQSSGPTTSTQKRFTTPRLTYIQLSAALLFGACIFGATFLSSVDQIWVLSAASGVSYGIVSAVGPSLVSKVWGPASFGRNFGVLWSLAAVGPVVYGLEWGSVSDHYAREQGADTCKGRICFSFTFWTISAGAVVAFVLCSVLKRRESWKRV